MKTKIFKVIQDCTISWRDDRYNRVNDFILYTGSIFFIKQDVGWERGQDNKYYSFDMLDSIYYNKMIDINGNMEWTWIKDINIINPLIDRVINIRDYESSKLEDITTYYNRENSITDLLT